MEGKKMLLSIIIPVYNVERYVERCIRSCEEQDTSRSSYEIICINDGSTDNSLDVLNNVANNYENITILSQPNSGLSEARNTGMKHANGEYYFFVDSDDWITENSLSKIVSKLESEKPDVLAIGSVVDTLNSSKRFYNFYNTQSCTGKESLKKYWSFTAQTSIVKASFMSENNFSFCPGILHEDVELVPRMHYQARKISFINDVVYHFYSREGSITRSANPQKSVDLLKTVCPNLSIFYKTIDPEYKVYYDNLISMLLNNALSFICYCSEEDQLIINQLNYEKRLLWKHLFKSSRIKNKIEFVLFKIFPKHTLRVYKFLKK